VLDATYGGGVGKPDTLTLPRHWQVFSVTTAAVFLGSMDSGTVPVILPKIEADFPDASAATISFVLTAYTIALAALVVVSGRLGDRTGRRRMFLIGGVTFIVGSSLCAVAPTPIFLIGARLIEGTGHALFTPASIGLILAAFPEDKRSTAIGAWVAVGGIAAALGPAAGGLIVEYTTWRAAFVLNVVIAVPVVVRAFVLLEDSERSEEASLPDLASIVLLAATLATTSLAIVQVRAWGVGDTRLLTAAAFALVFGAAFAARSARTTSPVIDYELLQGRTFRVSSVASVLIAMAMFANLVMQAQFLQKVWGYSTLRAGFGVMPMSASAGLTSIFAARFARRYGHKVVILIGIATTACGMYLLAIASGESPSRYWTVFFPALVLIGTGAWGMAVSMMNATAAETLNADNFSVGMAVLQTGRQIGSILGASAFFGLFGSPAPDEIVSRFHELWLLVAFLPTIAFVICLRLPARSSFVRAR
jgi:EmrB/QacA subfamily drug resistance transporter